MTIVQRERKKGNLPGWGEFTEYVEGIEGPQILRGVGLNGFVHNLCKIALRKVTAEVVGIVCVSKVREI